MVNAVEIDDLYALLARHLYGLLAQVRQCEEDPVGDAAVVGLIGQVEDDARLRLSVAAGGNADGDRVAGEADLPLGEHIERMLNARLALDLHIPGNLVPLLLEELPDLCLQVCADLCFLCHITHL